MDATFHIALTRARQFTSSPTLRAGIARAAVQSVQWEKPSLGWVCINTNGTVSNDTGHSSAGGVIRDNVGNWILDFTQFTSCSPLEAKLWGMFIGLNLAWSRGFGRVIVQSDCL
ncbi:hypothetical protein F3Y22_tig00004620pilonHSYRG00019 [Hibiscus syriacus]|uniref:RNase H type-1 domain-containing protein n=1 Tax=Hibiscus syriacus TaxID=106335 RepID=A0A6A3CHP2_HIBSY|nr:hypothetical protein F3Y22_tig00004620pilonHSYRG00019 [Hibiscus syriacus]